MRGRGGFSLLEATIVFVVLTGLWLVLLPAVAGERLGLSGRVKCGDNLRQLGLAAIQYSDDQRFYPHVRRLRELDGDMDTPDTPRKMRLLFDLGYHDRPEVLLCPSSDDRAAPLSEAARLDPDRWSWSGGEAPPREPVGAPSAGRDPTLLETTELSFGWSRRTIANNTKGISPLAADRASRKPDGPARPPGLVGNHVGGLNVLDTSAHVSWLAAGDPGAATIAGVGTVWTGGSDWMSVEPPVAAPGLREPVRLHVADGRAFAWLLGPPAGLLLLLLGGVLLARRARERPHPGEERTG